MKRKIPFLMLILLMSGLTVSAQVEKGQLFLSGLNILSFQAGSIRNTISDVSTKTTFSSFSISPFSSIPSLVNGPSLNYGFSNKLTGGIFLTFTIQNEKGEVEYNNTDILVGPNLRYYLLDQKKFLPFVEGRVGIGSSNYKIGSSPSIKSTLFGWHLGAGATYFFTPGIGVDLTLGYENIIEKEKDSDSKTTFEFVQFGTGILVVF